MDLFSPETVARVTRQTSLDAFDEAKPRIPRLQLAIWRALNEHGPHTPDEMAERLGENILTVRPAFTKMTKENMIADTGDRRRNASKRQAMVWRARPSYEWRAPPEHLTASEQVELLKERVGYLELLLTKEGIAFAPGRPV
jgi:predicted ArsR family transcriptional regulator